MRTGKIIFQEIMKGKSLSRTLQNLAFSEVTLSGQGLDLGSKSNQASYYRFLNREEGTRILYTDLLPQDEGILQVDLEKEIPVPDSSQDFLLLNNVLEHLYHYEVCVAEAYRVLQKSGRLIGVVPFLREIHLDPDDFFRYTASSLTKLFTTTGFATVEVTPLCVGPVTTAVSFIAPLLKLKLLVAICTYFSVQIDNFLNKRFPHNNKIKCENYPLSYFFICTK